MGIIGLQSFMEINCKDVFEQISLSEKANLYRSERGKDPVLIVDVSSSACAFYQANMLNTSKVLLGGYKKFKEDLEKFVSECTHLGIKLKAVGDGKKPTYKRRYWKQNIMTDGKKLKEIYSTGKITDSHVSLQNILINIFFNVLKDNCEYSRAVYEADTDIIQYQKSEECFAVLTNDTDLIMCNNVRYCLSFKQPDFHSMIFFHYNRSNLAKVLGINPTQLPLFASFCPSYGMNNTDLQKLYIREGIPSKDRFLRVPKLIKKFASEEELLQNIHELMHQKEIPYLEKRLKFFCGSDPNIEDVIPSGNTLWDEIIILALKRHTTGIADGPILQIITDHEYFVTVSFENILESSAGSALLAFRKKIYGIIFFEYPDSNIYVTEHTPVFSEEEDTVVRNVVKFPRRAVPWTRESHPEYLLGFHPGLLKLWSPCYAELEKTKIFCQVISEKLSVEFFMHLNLPEEYLFPVLAAFYLLWELDKRVQYFEVETILIQAVLVNNLTSEEIEKYHEKLSAEAFDIYWFDLCGWFNQIIQHFQLLNSVCGRPFCRFKTDAVNFFDGGIMRYVYGKMKEGIKPSIFLQPHLYKMYEILNSKLAELGRKCGQGIW